MESITIEKPWGKFDQYCLNEKATVKIITVNPDEELSRQLHIFRQELWVALDEGLEAETEVDNVIYRIGLSVGQELFIDRKTIHTISNRGKHPARFMEISFGHFDEEDIVRLSDKYGRA